MISTGLSRNHETRLTDLNHACRSWLVACTEASRVVASSIEVACFAHVNDYEQHEELDHQTEKDGAREPLQPIMFRWVRFPRTHPDTQKTTSERQKHLWQKKKHMVSSRNVPLMV